MTWSQERWTIPDGRLVCVCDEGSYEEGVAWKHSWALYGEQAACWSGDSHYLAYALDGDSEFSCLVFDHVVPRISARFYQRIPLGSYTVIDEEDPESQEKEKYVV